MKKRYFLIDLYIYDYLDLRMYIEYKKLPPKREYRN